MMMSIYCQASCSILLTLSFFEASSAAPVLDDTGSNAGSLSVEPMVAIAAVAVLICLIVLLLGCADICQKTLVFKDFDNDAFQTENHNATGTSSEFTMYPPVENTPDSVLATPIVFEPLPDITARLQQRNVSAHNISRLRPRVSQLAHERVDSEDSLDEAIQRDSMQEKVKLQNLLTNSRQQLPRSQLQYIKELGNGWFGKILQGEGQGILPGHKKTKVVIQMLNEDADTHDQLGFLEEGAPYRDVQHPNVVKLLGQCIDTSPLLTVMELCPFGDLKNYLRSHRVAIESFNEKGLLLKFACEMAAGLQALHEKHFVHRDFSCRNCLLSSDLTVKVGDYGLSEETFREDYYVDSFGDAIPIRWLAPETMLLTEDGVILRRITKQANVWSYAVSVWEVLTFGALPYSDLSNDHVLRLVVHEKCIRLSKPDIAVTHLDRIYQLINLCWTEASHRPSLRELRIMFLHLMSLKEAQDTTAFDIKWNQLMPRRPPQVIKVAPSAQHTFSNPRGPAVLSPTPSSSLPQQANGNIHTLSASHSSVIADIRPLGGGLRPSGFQSNFVELNASKLALAGSLQSEDESESDIAPIHRRHTSGGSHQGAMQTNPTSPVNELSLEAEFTRVNAAACVSDDGTEYSVEEQAPNNEQKSPFSELSILAEFTKTDKTPEKKTEKVKSEDTLQMPTDISPIKSQGPVPDVVAGSTMMPGIGLKSPDFMSTSTPKKKGDETSDGDTYLTASGGNSTNQQTSSSFYRTALVSQRSNPGDNLRQSFDYEDNEGSYFGQQKFASMLQTVALTSIDDDEMDSFSPQPRTTADEDDVFRQKGTSSKEYQQVPTEGSVLVADADITITDSIEEKDEEGSPVKEINHNEKESIDNCVAKENNVQSSEQQQELSSVDAESSRVALLKDVSGIEDDQSELVLEANPEEQRPVAIKDIVITDSSSENQSQDMEKVVIDTA